jgi:hypothetical protein
MGLGFLDHMRVVPDHRISGMVTYPLDEILLATLAGVVCGADDWEGIEEIASGAMDRLRRLSAVCRGRSDGADFSQSFSSHRRAGASARLCRLGGVYAGGCAPGDRGGRQDAAWLEDIARRDRRAASGFGLRPSPLILRTMSRMTRPR